MIISTVRGGDFRVKIDTFLSELADIIESNHIHSLSFILSKLSKEERRDLVWSLKHPNNE